MKYIISLSLVIWIHAHAFAQNDLRKKMDEENKVLGNKILEEQGMKYFDSSSYRIVFDWKKTRPILLDFSSLERSLRETNYHGQKLKILKEDLCVHSESITAEEIANTIFKYKDGKELRIKDVGRVERLPRSCTGAVNTPDGLFINCRTIDNKPQIFLFANNSISEFLNLKDYLAFDYSSSANEVLVGKYDIDPKGESMCREIYTYNLTTQKFTFQCNIGWLYGATRYTTNYDSVKLTTIQLRSDGVGGDWVTKKIKLK
jgi:hypothetical protein